MGILMILILGLVLFNVYATYLCIRSPYADKVQKFFQIVIVWLIPIIGGVVVSYFAKPEQELIKGIGNDGHRSDDGGGA